MQNGFRLICGGRKGKKKTVFKYNSLRKKRIGLPLNFFKKRGGGKNPPLLMKKKKKESTGETRFFAGRKEKAVQEFPWKIYQGKREKEGGREKDLLDHHLAKEKEKLQ